MTKLLGRPGHRDIAVGRASDTRPETLRGDEDNQIELEIVVTVLHLVVGAMAPKSWAIAHPGKSATMLATRLDAF